MSSPARLVVITLVVLVLTVPAITLDPQRSHPVTEVPHTVAVKTNGEAVSPTSPVVGGETDHDHRPRPNAASDSRVSPGTAPSDPGRPPRGGTASLDAPVSVLGCSPADVCVDPDGGERATVRARPRDQTPDGIETVYGNPGLTHTTGGRGVDVAVLDTGVASSHPDLRRRIDLCRDYTVEPVRQGSCEDDNGHGTHVAGTILADAGPTGNGIYGVAPAAELYAFRVCTTDGNCTSTRVSAGIRDAVDAGAEIVVLSLGGTRDPRVLSAVQYAHDEGVLVVASAGNRGPDLDTMNYPAADERVVSVGALERVRTSETITPADVRVADFSSRGRDDRAFERRDGYLEVSAPGIDVLSTWPDGYRERSGTSLAVPHVAGLAAKLWPLTPDRDDDGHRHEDVRRVLQRRASDFDVTEGRHARSGYDPAAGLGLPQVRPPRAVFTHVPAAPIEGRTVRFSAARSSAPDSAVVRYEWDFDDDGAIDARVETVSVVFETPGRHRVSLRVVDADGADDTETRIVRVGARPIAAFTHLPPIPVQGEATRFDAAPSVDPDGTIVAYEWDFDGDGIVDARGPTATYTFTDPGVHDVTLRVTDDAGATAAVTEPLRVGIRPVATIAHDPLVPEQNTPVQFDASRSVDPDGTITVYEWDFDDDGATDARGQVVSHSFEAVGTHPVTLRVTDNDGVGNSTTRSVLVNDRPDVSFTGSTDVSAGEPVTLTATVTDEIGSTTTTWEFPDGTSATGTTVVHTFDPGRQVVTVTAEDEFGARTTRAVTLTVRAAPGTTPTPPGEGQPSPTTDGRPGTGTTARPGPGFAGVTAVTAFGVLGVAAVLRRYLLSR